LNRVHDGFVGAPGAAGSVPAVVGGLVGTVLSGEAGGASLQILSLLHFNGALQSESAAHFISDGISGGFTRNSFNTMKSCKLSSDAPHQIDMATTNKIVNTPKNAKIFVPAPQDMCEEFYHCANNKIFRQIAHKAT
jgi:hypothetical protein